MEENYSPSMTNPLAVLSLITGILSIIALVISLCIPCGIRIIGLILGVAATIMGVIAKNKIDSSMGSYTGRHLAVGGIITGLIGAVLCLVLMVLFLLFPLASLIQPGFLEGFDALEGLY